MLLALQVGDVLMGHDIANALVSAGVEVLLKEVNTQLLVNSSWM